jgi:hypothetical protein
MSGPSSAPEKSGNPNADAFSILAGSAATLQSTTLRVAGVCPNIMMTLHEGNCDDCVRFAHHAGQTMVPAAAFNDVEDEALERALRKSFPRYVAHVDELIREYKEGESRLKRLQEDIDSLEEALTRAKKERDGYIEARNHFEASFKEAKNHYLHLREVIKRDYECAELPANLFNNLERRIHPEDHLQSSECQGITSPFIFFTSSISFLSFPSLTSVLSPIPTSQFSALCFFLRILPYYYSLP